MAIYFIADWWLIIGIESGISWLGTQSCPFPQRRCCRRTKKLLETSVSEDLNLVLELSNFGFRFSWREKHTKSVFFTHHGCKQVCLWSWFQHSSSPFLCLATSLQLKTPPLCLAILPIPFSLSPQSVLSPAISSSLQILSDFAKLARQKGQKVFPKCNDSGSSRSFPLVPWKHLFCKGKGNMHNKSTLEDACTRRECSAICPLNQGKEETDAQQKHFGRCMHKECFLICPLKHFFSKGKKKTIAQQKHFGGSRRSFPIVHCSISMREERKKDEPKQQAFEEAGVRVFLLSLAAFLWPRERRKDEQKQARLGLYLALVGESYYFLLISLVQVCDCDFLARNIFLQAHYKLDNNNTSIFPQFPLLQFSWRVNFQFSVTKTSSSSWWDQDDKGQRDRDRDTEDLPSQLVYWSQQSASQLLHWHELWF